VGFDGSGTFPWTASPEQLSIMLTRDLKLVSCSQSHTKEHLMNAFAEIFA
jgi:hypothetical protein